jgi:hypothetical protein
VKAMESTFTSDKTSLFELLGNIHSGKIQLPDFQRGWVWDDEHIRDLIESVSLSYPIGTIVLLETGSESVRFKPRGMDGAPQPKEKLEYLILDGQQRLTSLYHALFSEQVVSTKDSRKKPIRRWYYMDMRAALSLSVDRSDAIVSLAEERQVKNFRGEVEQDYSTKDKEYESGLFPLNQVFDSASWRRGFNAHWKHGAEKGELFDNFEKEVIDRFKSYLVPVIIVKKQTPKEAVCQVFEKVNTGGVNLTVFELLTATFAADDFGLRDDWAERARRFRERKVLTGVRNTDFLQAIALLVTYTKRLRALGQGTPEENAPGISCKRKEILRLTVDEYKEWADRADGGFLQAARFLRRQRIFDARDLPYRTQVVPLAAVLAWLERDAEPDGVQAKLAQWYYCGVLGELYGSAVESRFARDLPEIASWVCDDAPPPKTVKDANFIPNRLYTLRTRNSAAYKGIHALLMREGCLDFRTGQTIEEQIYFEDQIDIHHIFPRSWCDQNGVDTGRRDCIVNKTPLSARTNRIIGGNAPTVYIPSLQRTASIEDSRMDSILQSHVVDPASIRADDFEAFFRAREDALLSLIGQAMGKPVMRESVNPELQLEDDYEGLENQQEPHNLGS